MGTVTIHRTYFRESEIFEGDYNGLSTYTETEVFDELTAREAADRIEREGLHFQYGTEWADNVDGSRELYHTPFGKDGGDWRVEESAHLSEFPDRVSNAIREVGRWPR